MSLGVRSNWWFVRGTRIDSLADTGAGNPMVQPGCTHKGAASSYLPSSSSSSSSGDLSHALRAPVE